MFLKILNVKYEYTAPLVIIFSVNFNYFFPSLCTYSGHLNKWEVLQSFCFSFFNLFNHAMACETLPDLIPQTRDQTHAPCTGNTVLTTDCQGNPQKALDLFFLM